MAPACNHPLADPHWWAAAEIRACGPARWRA